MKYTRPFARMLEGLPDSPVIVEIGVAHAPEGDEAMSQGWSSLAFAEHIQAHGGELYCIDVEKAHLDALVGILERHLPYSTHVFLHEGRGETVISQLDLRRIDLLYVDGGVGGEIAAVQVASALEALRNGHGRVVFDDCPTDDDPAHWQNPEMRVSAVWADPAAHGLKLEWRDSVCVAFRAC